MPPELAPTRPRWTWTEAAARLLPLALAAAAYARCLDGAFQFDDLEGLVERRAVKDLAGWLGGAPPAEFFLTGRPLTTLSFAANYALGRLDPLGYHLVNLACHLAATWLAFRLAHRVGELAGALRPRRLAAGVAGLFAVHPLQSQAVAYVSQRAELLASALFVGALLLLLPPPGPAPGRPWARRAGALLLFLLAFSAKPMALTLPAAWLLLRLASPPPAPGERPAWRAALPWAAALGALSAALAVALLGALRGRPDAGLSVAGVTPWRYLVTQAEVVATYLRLLAWPAGLSVDWAWPTSPGLSHPATLASAALVAAVLAGGAALLWRGGGRAGPGAAAARLAGLGILWFFLLLAPTSSVVPLADNLVEHRTYLANWGALLAAVAGADWLAARLGRPRLAAGAWAAAVLALGLALAARTPAWRTREALWRDAAAKNPGAMRPHLNLGQALAEEGRLDEAVAELREALRVSDGVPRHEATAFLDLGVALLDAGRPDEARGALEAGLRRDPAHDLLLLNLAAVEGAAGRLEAAEALARRAQVASPGQPGVQVLFGNLAMERGDAAGALEAFARALALDPERGEAHYGRALVLQALERPAEACAELSAALATPLRPVLRAEVSALRQARCR